MHIGRLRVGWLEQLQHGRGRSVVSGMVRATGLLLSGTRLLSVRVHNVGAVDIGGRRHDYDLEDDEDVVFFRT
jgi:hypothetical protein